MSYRDSHTDVEYGKKYQAGYSYGYNRYQWEICERPIVEKLFKEFSVSADTRYLDFACGTGRILSVAEQFFNDPHGVDISEEMLSVAQSATKHSTLINKDITEEPLTARYDVITSFRFFTNAEKELSLDVLAALRNSLSSEGRIVVGFHRNSHGILATINRLRGLKPVVGGAQFMGIDDATEYMNICGFEISNVIWYSFLPKFSVYPNWMLRFFLGPFDSAVRAIPFLPKRWAQCFILICRKKSE